MGRRSETAETQAVIVIVSLLTPRPTESPQPERPTPLPFDTAAGARLSHEVDRVQVDLALAAVVFQGFHHFMRDALAGA